VFAVERCVCKALLRRVLPYSGVVLTLLRRCVNPTQACVNPTQACVNPTQALC
jgi:hypothetical protein